MTGGPWRDRFSCHRSLSWAGINWEGAEELAHTGVRASLKPLKSERESRSVLSGSLLPHGLYSPWNSPGQNTEVGGLSLLQGIFPTQGSNPGLLNCRRKPLEVIPKTILDGAVSWIAHCFSRSLIQAFVLDKNAAWSWEGCVKVMAQGSGGAGVCARDGGKAPLAVLAHLPQAAKVGGRAEAPLQGRQTPHSGDHPPPLALRASHPPHLPPGRQTSCPS